MPLDEQEKGLAQEAAAAHHVRENAATRPEKRIALVPKVITQRWSGIGWVIMEGSIILTDKRIVFIPDEIIGNTSLLAAAGALGGVVGALVAAMASKGPSEESRDLNRSLDDIVASSKSVLELRYEDLERLECKPGRRILQINVHRKTDGRLTMKTKMQLAMPDGFLKARASEGIDRKRAWDEYCTKCRTAFESSVLGRGVDIEWTK